MDGVRFDAAVRALSCRGSRRGFLALLAAVPLPVGITPFLDREIEAAGRRHRRKKRHHHRQGDNKDNRKGKRKGKNNGKRTCTPELATVTCAGHCAMVTNNCGGPVDCGPCPCSTGCPPCQTCGATTGQCVPLEDGTACDDGNACTQTDTCQGGVCVGSNPVLCPSGHHCDGGSCVCTPTTCAAQGKNCGILADGCGSTLDCGGCSSPNTCGGGSPGIANVCGCCGACAPRNCAQQGIECGPAGDGCGGLLNCGNCPSGQTCGGGARPNTCG